jgi:hypothetical protein
MARMSGRRSSALALVAVVVCASVGCSAETTEPQGHTESRIEESCRPVVRRSFSLDAVQLRCQLGTNTTTVFAPTLDVRGRAVARMVFDADNAAAIDGTIHGMGGQVVVGEAGLSGPDRFRVGEPVCNGQIAQGRQMLGFGTLTDADPRVTVSMRMYRSSDCQDGMLTVRNAKLDVWVEDPRPACAGTSIAFHSFWQDVGKVGAESHLGTGWVPLIGATLNLKAASDILVLSQVQGTIDATANGCGSTYDSAEALLHRHGEAPEAGFGSPRLQYIPPSGGQTHMVLFPSALVRSEPSGSVTFLVSAKVNEARNVGMKVGYAQSGDSFLALVANP